MDGGVFVASPLEGGSADDMVVDHIVVDSADPAVVYAAAWTSDHSGGGLWISHDGGRIWAEV